MQHERGCERDVDAAVEHAVLHDALACAHQAGDGTDERDAQHGQYQADNHDEADHHRENAVGLFPVAAAQFLGDERAATRAEHEARAAQHHDEWHDEIQRRERRFADIVGDKEAVHHVVNRCEDHHDDGGRDEVQQSRIGEVVGKLNGGFIHGCSPCQSR